MLLSLTHKNKSGWLNKSQTFICNCGLQKKNNPLSEKQLANIRKKSIERVGVAVSVFNFQTNEVK